MSDCDDDDYNIMYCTAAFNEHLMKYNLEHKLSTIWNNEYVCRREDKLDNKFL